MLFPYRSGYGPWGTWRSWQDCPTGELYTAFTMKVEGDQGSGGDDSSVNGVTMTCNGGEDPVQGFHMFLWLTLLV